MANNKKKKNNVKKSAKAPVKKNVKNYKNETKKEEVVDNSKLVKELIIIVIIIAAVFGIVYLLTVGATKLGWFDPHYIKPDAPEAIISYENIEVGTMFDRIEEEYYVILSDGEKDSYYLSSLTSNYEEKDDALKIYTVDLSDGLNSSVVSNESNTTSSKVTELKINDTTLIHVRNGQNVESFVGIDNIANVLK